MLRRVFLPILDFIAPPSCVACDNLLAPGSPPGTLCPNCFEGLAFHNGPQCTQCATHIDALFVRDDLRCGRCLSDPPAFQRTLSPFVYGGTARDLILAHKHGGRRVNAKTLGQHMARMVAPSSNGTILIPVPLHRSRLRQRGFNQSLDLARVVAKHTGLAILPNTVLRTRNTASQGIMSARARARNLVGAFEIKRTDLIKGKHLILIDDVVTSGATARALSKVMTRAGARSVQVLAAARALPK